MEAPPDGGAPPARGEAWRHSPWHASCSLCSVQLGPDGAAHFLRLLLQMFSFFLPCSLVLVKPVDNFITLVKSLPSGLIVDLALKCFIFHSCFHVEYRGLSGFLEDTWPRCFSSSALYFSTSWTLRLMSSLWRNLMI